MKTILKIALALGATTLFSTEVWAQSSYAPGSKAPAEASFIKKRYNIKGTWKIIQQNGQNVIQFNDDFKTKGGPDLKVFLSSSSISNLDGSSVENTSLKLGILKSKKGAQSYIIPQDVNLSDYKSVVIHCEAFSVLWGGFDIAKTP